MYDVAVYATELMMTICRENNCIYYIYFKRNISEIITGKLLVVRGRKRQICA